VSVPAPALDSETLEKRGPVPREIDLWMLAGVAVAIGAVVAGLISAGVHLSYFFQPTGVSIVLGGSLGVTLITTPRMALIRAMKGALELVRSRTENRAELIDEIVTMAKNMRPKGLFGLEPLISDVQQPFLRDSLMLALDARNREELHTSLEIKLRQWERQGETEARAFEVAGGFAPTIGVLGTVVGLMDVLRQFSNIASVAAGTGTAFVSTIYGLALANLILLPTAQRMRAHTAEEFETNEMIVEATLCLFDGLHPTLVRDRLSCYLRREEIR
jgi:chemotaxis protein MotA